MENKSIIDWNIKHGVLIIYLLTISNFKVYKRMLHV